MSEDEINLFKRTGMAAFFNCALASLFFLIGERQGVAIISGAILSSIFIVSSGWVLHTFRKAENSLFMQVFFFSMVIRFVLVLLLFSILLGLTKIDKIYFTVSFIISYLCQSITEMIFINKILQKSSD
jgi:hypothetical protein